MEKIKMLSTERSVGGHFSLVLEQLNQDIPGNFFFNSARSALYALLSKTNAKRVYLPNYVCDAVWVAAKAAGLEIVSYPLSSRFLPENPIDLKKNDLILLVNYFGLTEPHITEFIQNHPKDKIIVDCSQSYFCAPFDCLGTIYSPRKFLPVADGGIINTDLPIDSTPSNIEASLKRYKYLLARVDSEPEESRSMYLESEESLEKPCLERMSHITLGLLRSFNKEYVAESRRRNFISLSILDGFNKTELEARNQVPLCYPYMTKSAPKIREKLFQNRIFTPQYWPSVKPENDFEDALLSETIFLPIDHRYNHEDMHRLSRIILDS